MIEVAIALVWNAGELLVARRPDGVHLAGLWEFPGGKLLPGESPEHCAAREVLEETGVVVRPIRRRALIEHAYPERNVRLYPIDCELVRGTPEPLACAELAWVRPENLTAYQFPPANAELVKELAGA